MSDIEKWVGKYVLFVFFIMESGGVIVNSCNGIIEFDEEGEVFCC